MADSIITNEELVQLLIQKLTRLKKYDSAEHTHDVLLGYVDEVTQTVENYCQIPHILFAMRFIVVNMCSDYVIYGDEVGRDIEEVDLNADPADLSSVKVGDVTIGLGDKYRSNMRKTVLNAHTYDLDSVLLNYKDQLNRFRRIW